MNSPIYYSERIGNFQIMVVGPYRDENQDLKFKVLIKPNGQNQVEILPWGTFDRACYLFRMIEKDGDWKDYKKYIDFLDGK